MLRAVIFDFDGVISDSESLHLKAFNKILAQFNIEINERDYYNEYLGFTDLDCFNAVTEKHQLGLNPAAIEKLIGRKSRVFEEFIKKEDTIIEGVPEFLQMLGDNKVRMAICSGALRLDIDTILAGMDIAGFFDVIVTEKKKKKGKPNPEGFLLALEKLNETETVKIAPAECIVIEDSHWGLQAATAAGMHTIAVTNSYKPEELKMAEKVVTRLDKLLVSDLNSICA